MTHEVTRSEARMGICRSRPSPLRAPWLAFICAVGVAAMLPAQRTWIVDNTAGLGYDFTDLVEAYTVISPGDTLHVRNTGVPYQMPYLMDKGARIIGLGPTRVPVVCTDPVISLPANQFLVVDGFIVDTQGPDDVSFRVVQNVGRVLISNVYFPPTHRGIGGTFESSPVFLADCIMESVRDGIGAASSTLFLQNCQTLSYSSGSSGGRGVEYAPIKAGLGGLVWIIGGHHQGGDGSWYCDPWGGPIWFEAGPAVWGGRMIVVGPAVIEGGWVPASPCANGGGGPWQEPRGIWLGACVPGRDYFVYDPLMQCGFSQTCIPFGTITRHEFPAVIPGPATRNQPQTFDLYGPTQSIVALFASFAHPYDPIVLPVGDVWLDPTLVVCVGVAPVDAQRHASMQTRIPGWMAIGDVLVYQAVSLSQQSTFEISPPGFSVIH